MLQGNRHAHAAADAQGGKSAAGLSTPDAMRHLIAETGASQIMIGTDYPFPWTSTEVDLVLNTPGLSADERIAILGGTAARLLGINP